MGNYAADISKRLENAGVLPAIGWKERSIISVSENGKTYSAPVAKGLKSAVYQVDGDIIKTGVKCDKYLAALNTNNTDPNGVAVFIELKGKDISHAIDQLEATLKSQQFQPYTRQNDLAPARIVTPNCGPKSSSKAKLESARIRFKTLYHTELRILKTLQTDNLITI